ncbi:hypothetical protein VNO80_15061 [Phaseolus coccineus]|uniref:Uncharacterized protein n=1 Tax=Phaseolus coccineus TaxID=3886 RepID=A0AAN9MJJ9_PHACN
MYTTEIHNSVPGIREYALGHGAADIAVDIEEDIHPAITGGTLTTKMTLHQVQRRNVAGSPEGEPTGDVYNLFASSSECNFSGLRFGLDLVKIIKEDTSKSLGVSSVCNFLATQLGWSSHCLKWC